VFKEVNQEFILVMIIQAVGKVEQEIIKILNYLQLLQTYF
jgi:hypothetical protein